MTILFPRYEGPRHPRPGEGAALLRFLERIFRHRPVPGWTMAREYPHLYGDMEAHPEWAHVITHEGRIVAHVGVYPLAFVSDGRRIPTGGIGAVATDPDYRGQGLMARLLEHVTGWMRAHGMPVSILWGDTRRYARFGWVPAGEGTSWAVEGKAARRGLGRYVFPVAELARPWREAAALHALHRRLPLRVERAAAAFPLILRKWRRRIFAARDGRRIVAYAIAQAWNGRRGRTWRIEELAGSGAGRLSLVRELATRPGTAWVRGRLGPGYGPEAAALYEVAEGWELSTHPIGQIKVIDEPGLLAAFGAGGIAPALARAGRPGGRRTQLLFGPARPRQVLPPGPVRRRLEVRLPFPYDLTDVDHV